MKRILWVAIVLLAAGCANPAAPDCTPTVSSTTGGIVMEQYPSGCPIPPCPPPGSSATFCLRS